MRKCLLAFTVASLAFASVSMAGAVQFTWSSQSGLCDEGENPVLWSLDANWFSTSGTIPCSSGDEAFINSSQTPNCDRVEFDESSCSIDSLTIDANDVPAFAPTYKHANASTSLGVSECFFNGKDATYPVTLDIDFDGFACDTTTITGDVAVDVASGATASLGYLNGDLTIDASGGAATLEKTGSGTLRVSFSFFASVEAGATSGYDATLKHSAGTLALRRLNLLGGTSGRLALFDYDSGTISTLNTINMYGYSKITADEDIDFASDEVLYVKTDASGNPAVAEIDMANGKTFTARRVAVTGGDVVDETATLTLTNGRFDLGNGSSPLVEVRSGSGSNSTGRLDIGSGVEYFTATAASFLNDSILDTDADAFFYGDLAIGNGLTDTTDVTFNIGTAAIVDVNLRGSLVIKGDNTSDSKFTVVAYSTSSLTTR